MPYGLIPARAAETNPVEDAVFLLLAVFAVFTFTYDLALLVPISLRNVTLISAAACVLPLLAVARTAWRGAARLARHIAAHRADPASWLLVAFCLLAAAAGLLARRFDPDDGFYLARAVLDWENFRASILAAYPGLSGDGAARFASLPAWEHLWAAAAALTGLHPLALYSYAAPLAGGLLVPVAWYAALARISHSRRAALAGTAAVLLLMLLDGTTPRGIAQFGLLRIWQGKVVLTAALAPLATAVTLDLMRHGRPADWVRLAILGIAGLGLSSSAAFFLPVLVGLAGGSFWLVYLPPTRIWQPLLAALVVFAYPALAVLPFYPALAGTDPVVASAIASDLREVLLVVYGRPAAPLVIAAMLSLVGLALGRRTRLLGWFALWAALLAVPLAWPPASDFITAHLTSADALWRLAYAGPVVLMVGAGIGAMTELRRLRGAVLVALAGTAALALWLGIRAAPPSPFATVRLALPAPKASAETLAAARTLIAGLPAGTILAPRALTAALAMLSGRQLVLDPRPYELRPAADLARAFDLADGQPASPEALAALGRIAGPGLATIVLRDQPDAAALLAGLGYTAVPLGIPYAVFRRGA